MRLADRIVELDAALARAAIPHAFGGALALAWCTQQARGTIDIDVNLFVDAADAGAAIDVLPDRIEVTADDRRRIELDGQTRLWWDSTPVDVFFNTTAFHVEAASRVRFEAFAGARVPFLACDDLAVFKAFFGRTQDWADLEAMHDAGTLHLPSVLGVLATYLGGADPRIERLRRLADRPSPPIG